MTTKTKSNVTKAQETKLGELTTMSAKIRYLSAQGMSRGDISRVLKIRYQWVRNVLVTPVKEPREKV